MSFADKDIAGKLTEIAQNQQKVYDAGHSKGFIEQQGIIDEYLAYFAKIKEVTNTNASNTTYIVDDTPTGEYYIAISDCIGDSFADGIVDGRYAVLDEFWEAYQNGGNRTEYRNAFYGSGWTDTTFKPKYSIRPVGSVQGMFQSSSIKNLAEILEAQGVVLDFSACTTLSYAFYLSKVTHLGVIDTTSATSISDTFTYSYDLHTIDLLRLKSNGSQTIGSPFMRCDSLKNITIEGAIGDNINFKDSPLSKSSIKSVMGCLSDSATEKTITFKMSAVNEAFKDSEEDGLVTTEWIELAGTKPNWTIGLV